MPKKKKRLSLFRYGARAASKYRNGDDTLYFCPICSRGFPEEAAATGILSLEHVPIDRVGGKELLLTCTDCNSGSGHTIDAATAALREIQDFSRIATGRLNGLSNSTTLEMGEQRLVTTLTRREGTTEIKIVGKANDPRRVSQLDNHMKSIANGGKWNGYEFKLSKTVKFPQRLAKIGNLKSAFLLVFVWLGYRYAFDNRLIIVREQILNPKKEILRKGFWVTLDQGDAPQHVIAHVSNPLSFLVVNFEWFEIILPWLDSPPDLYERLSNIWHQGEHIRINPDFIVPWPDKLQLQLDLNRNTQ
jgi:hypothetical protein